MSSPRFGPCRGRVLGGVFATVKPYIQLAEASLPDGTRFTLHTHDGQFYLKNDGHDLMSTALTFSERMLADQGCRGLTATDPQRPAHPRVLIGGLGMGFTLKRTLELLARPATVTVAELVPEVIEWNRTFLAAHNGPLLEDERTQIFEGDLFDCLEQHPGPYDAMLMDIDDGPDSLITRGNHRLYAPGFIDRLRASLKPGGTLAYWLAVPLPRFATALRKRGFQVDEQRSRPHEKSKRDRHAIYVARRN